MAATTTNLRPTTVPVAPRERELDIPAARGTAAAGLAPRRPSHAARRVATALRGVDGRLMLICPA